MRWTVKYAKSAAKAIRRLDPQIQTRIKNAIETLADDPLRGKRLHLTLQGLRSWRTGDWRIVYRIVEEQVEVLVVAVGHRQDVYDRLRNRIG